MFLDFFTLQTLLNTLSTDIIIQKTSHTKSRALTSPIVLDCAVSMILFAKPRTMSMVSCELVKYSYSSSFSLSASPRPPVMAKITARNGTADIVPKKLRATAWNPIFSAEKVLMVIIRTLRYLILLALAREKSSISRFQISSVMKRFTRPSKSRGFFIVISRIPSMSRHFPASLFMNLSGSMMNLS